MTRRHAIHWTGVALFFLALAVLALDRRVDVAGDHAPISAPDRVPPVKMLGGVPIEPLTAAQWNGLFTGSTRSYDCGLDQTCRAR